MATRIKQQGEATRWRSPNEARRKRNRDASAVEDNGNGASGEQDESRHIYRCPACGELVDTRVTEEMARHHRHVLFPRSPDSPHRRSQKLPA
jgi:hypothetical protein